VTARRDADGTCTVAELLELRQRVVPRGVSTANPTVIDSAEGATWVDADGEEWIDFTGGIGVLNVGAGHPQVRAAVHEQVDRLLHTCSHVAWHEPYLRLAERLAEVAPIEGPAKTLLCNSGAEAVENAVKIARAATGRPLAVAFDMAFHGRTLLALSLTGKEHPYKDGVGPFVDQVRRVPYASCFHCPVGLAYPGCGIGCLEGLRRLLAADGDRVAAVIVEPVQGEGGFFVPPPEFLPMVAELTRAAGALLIVDEIQSGFGRTGRLFACEHTAVRPDLLVTAKSLAAGLPLSAVVGRAAVMDAPGPGALGGTYGGSPVACAAALAVLDLFADGELARRADRLGARVLTRMRAWQEETPAIGDVRGLGAMVAMELVVPGGGPATELALRLQRACQERHLLVIRCGLHDTVVRLLFPLTIDDATLDAGLGRLEAALGAAVDPTTTVAAPGREAPVRLGGTGS